jgi:hypothetical protein
LLTQADLQTTGSWGVSDAHYRRTQAALCFELSRRMSLRGDAEYSLVRAERHLVAERRLAAERRSVAERRLAMAAEGEGENTNPSFSPQTSSPAQANEGRDHAAVLLPGGL